MPKLDDERRRATRYRFVVPVQFKDGSFGQTLDMSTQGILFEADQSYALGETIRFTVLFNESIVQCQGTVVRVEPLESMFGMAVELEHYEFA